MKDIIEILNNMSATLRQSAKTLDRIAEKIEERGDLFYCGEAMNEIVSCINNLHLNLLVTRPIRGLLDNRYNRSNDNKNKD